MYVLLLFLLLILVYTNIEYFKYKRVHPYGFPLLKEVNEYIHTSECKNITEKIANHPALGYGGFDIHNAKLKAPSAQEGSLFNDNNSMTLTGHFGLGATFNFNNNHQSAICATPRMPCSMPRMAIVIDK